VPNDPRFAIIVARFPKLTETFILQELRGLEDRGLDFELFSLIHESPDQRQPGADALDNRANYFSWRSPASIATQLYWMRRSPVIWAHTWWTALQMSRRQRALLVPFPMTVLIAMQMARRAEDLGIDRVHAHWATYPTLAALVIKELTGIPYSFTGHATDIFNERSGLARKLDESDFMATCVEYTEDVIRRRCGDAAREKVEVIHHGVDLDRFELLPLNERTADDPLHILCVAGLHPYKGQRHLIDSIVALKSSGTECSLRLVGDGEMRGSLERQVEELGIAESVEFLGRQSSDVVRAELERCDVFAAASIQTSAGLMDGIPNVLVEALACGRPVVASALPGIRDLINDGKNGLLAPAGDPLGFAEQLERLAKDPALARNLVEQGRATVEAEFDASENLDTLFARLRSLGAE
jgi:colanic acid/amylovoran biosynthesis glycosyltransferase